MVSFFLRPRVVRVTSYFRTRFGRREQVCSHWRSMSST